MSWEHYHAFLDVFNGTTAERLVLSLFAASCDENGITHPSASVSTIARRAGMERTNVRRIVRKYEAEPGAKKTPGKYLYPTGEKARQGQLHVTRYRMPLRPLPGDGYEGREPRNPTGEGYSNPPRRVTATPHDLTGGGLQQPTPEGYRDTGGGLQGSTGEGYSNPQETIEKFETAAPPGDTPPTTYEKRGEGLTTLPPDDELNQGASPPNPPAPTGSQAVGEDHPDQGHHLPDGARQTTLAEFIEPTLIEDHQDIKP